MGTGCNLLTLILYLEVLEVRGCRQLDTWRRCHWLGSIAIVRRNARLNCHSRLAAGCQQDRNLYCISFVLSMGNFDQADIRFGEFWISEV
jgi:hypothetical protein